MLVGEGRKDEAIALLRAAAEVSSSIGAIGDLATIDTMLRSLGVRRRRARASRPDFGWASLTTTERKVVRLVAEGLSNREAGDRLFISPRTVEAHLGHIFSKLSLTTRTQLAA